MPEALEDRVSTLILWNLLLDSPMGRKAISCLTVLILIFLELTFRPKTHYIYYAQINLCLNPYFFGTYF